MSRIMRTTLALPEELLAAIDRVVREGGAKSRNDLVALSLRRELAARERQGIDAAIAEMGQDSAYLEEAQRIMAEFAQADWEAFQEGERPL